MTEDQIAHCRCEKKKSPSKHLVPPVPDTFLGGDTNREGRGLAARIVRSACKSSP